MANDEIAARKKQSNIFLWLLIGVGIVVVGVVLFVLVKEKPPRHVSVADMEEEMVRLLEDYFSIQDLRFDLERHDLIRWRYNPNIGTEHQPLYEFSTPEMVPPVSEQQERLVWDPNAIIISRLPCATHAAAQKIFDDDRYDLKAKELAQGHRNMADKMVSDLCTQENFIYFTGKLKPDGKPIDAPSCIRCGYVYEFPAFPELAKIDAQNALPETRDKDRVEKFKKYWENIATKHYITTDELQKRISYGLVRAPIWPEGKDPNQDPDLVPIGYKGTIRFLRIMNFWDPMVRVHRWPKDRENDPPQKFSPVKPAEGQPVAMQYFRPLQLYLVEKDFEVRGGNLKWTSKDREILQPRGFVENPLLRLEGGKTALEQKDYAVAVTHLERALELDSSSESEVKPLLEEARKKAAEERAKKAAGWAEPAKTEELPKPKQ